jgi:hypothetical protein
MSARDLYSTIKRVPSIAPLGRTGDVTGASVDTRGYQSVTFGIDIGVGGITFDESNKIEFIAEHSDDGSAWTAVAAADVRGPETWLAGGIVKSLIAAHAAAASYKVGYFGQKRYVRMKADHTGTHGAATGYGVAVVLGHPHLAAVA